jgi:hypothetical protein
MGSSAISNPPLEDSQLFGLRDYNQLLHFIGPCLSTANASQLLLDNSIACQGLGPVVSD